MADRKGETMILKTLCRKLMIDQQILVHLGALEWLAVVASNDET